MAAACTQDERGGCMTVIRNAQGTRITLITAHWNLEILRSSVINCSLVDLACHPVITAGDCHRHSTANVWTYLIVILYGRRLLMSRSMVACSMVVAWTTAMLVNSELGMSTLKDRRIHSNDVL
eukprot:5102078-Pleurochrysis_carterae.AAC.14